MKLSSILESSTAFKLGDNLSVLTDYHANGSYKVLKEHVTLFDDKKFAVMIRTTNFEREEFTTDLKWISEDAYHFLRKSKVLPGDIIMNKIANAGSVYRMPAMDHPVSLAMNLFLIRTDGLNLDQTFTYYYLKNNESYIKSFANGTATKTITKDAVRNLEVLAPDMPVQKKIAEVMASFDDLIRINKLRMEEYENILSCIYSDWLLQLPNSKEECKLTDYIELVRGIEPGSKNYMSVPGETNMPFLRVGDLSKQSSSTFINRETRGIKVLEASDIAMTFDGSIGVVKTGLVGAYSTGIRKVVVKKKTLSPVFIYALLKSSYIQKQVMSYARGTTIKHASAAIPNLKFKMPDTTNIERFTRITTPILEQIRILAETNQRVALSRSIAASIIFRRAGYEPK